jgi:O-antigen ligase
MSTDAALGTLRRRTGTGRIDARTVVCAVGAILTGLVVAYLVAAGYWYVVLALLLVGPMFVVLHRYPLIAISVWLFLAPLVTVTDYAADRKVFWLVHRSLPVLTLIAIGVGSLLGVSDRKIAKLGWPELMMAGYLIASVLSILYTSDAALATSYLLYDRVFIPMCLYLIVRLLSPDERDLRYMLPAVGFLLVTQAAFGLMSWVAPGVLPSAWLVHEGQRTTGSLRDPDVYSVTVLFAGLFLLRGGLAGGHGRAVRVGTVALFVLALFMAFLTFSRAAWIAGLVAAIAVMFAYPKFARRFYIVAVPVLLLVLASGVMDPPLRFAHERLTSEESALSRLPVLVAAAHMFEAKPVTGWGFENFDRYSRPFQVRVGDLASAEKPHASHNLFLTILAEQGLVGFVLFLGPLVYWIVLTFRRWRSIPRRGGLDRRLLIVLWTAAATFLIVNNFVVVRITFGPGVYWLTLGLIGSIVHRYGPAREPAPADTAAGQLR